MNVKCYNCGVVHNCNNCPNCGAPARPAMRYPLPPANTNKKHMSAGLVVFLTLLGIFAFGFLVMVFLLVIGNMSGSQNNESQQAEARIQYKVCDISTMIQELDENALKAERKYQDQYIEVTGILSNIDSDGEYISIEPFEKWWFLDGIQCDIQNEEQINKILTLSIGDEITIKGQVTSIGEVLGYYMEIDEIE